MDFLKSRLDDIKASAGSVGKAVLCLKRLTGAQIPGGGASPQSILGNVLEKQSQKAMGTASLSNLGFNEIKDIVGKEGFMTVEVQYNPASIRFISTTPVMTYTDMNPNASIQTIAPTMGVQSTSMMVTLILEDINDSDAFFDPTDNAIPTNIGNVVTGIANMVGGTHSIRKYMEGFIGVLSSEATQEAIFYWGKLYFRGIITSVTASYKMFNKQGEPIYGEVQLRIEQFDDHDGKNKNIEYWQKRYKDLFEDQLPM